LYYVNRRLHSCFIWYDSHNQFHRQESYCIKILESRAQVCRNAVKSIYVHCSSIVKRRSINYVNDTVGFVIRYVRSKMICFCTLNLPLNKQLDAAKYCWQSIVSVLT
jgi:hypothetical protein